MEYWNLVFMQNERGPATGPGKSDFDVLGELPAQEHRHRHGHGAHGHAAAGRRQPLRDRRDAPGARARGRDGGQGLRRALGARGQRVAPRRRAAAHRRRPRPHRADAHRRRRHAVQRGPRLRAAPHHAPCGAGDAPARRRGPGAARSCCRSRATACRRPTPSWPTDFERISTYAYAEEEAFRQTLRAGTTIFDNATAAMREAGGSQLSGASAFQLHDTYGFPIDLTLEMAAEQGITRRRGRLPPADGRAAGPGQGRRAGQEDRARRPVAVPRGAGRQRAHELHRLPRDRPRGGRHVDHRRTTGCCRRRGRG